MIFAVAVLVAVACGFALVVCVRRFARITAVAALQPEVELRRLRAGRATPSGRAHDPTVATLQQLLGELHTSDDAAQRNAVQRELVLTLQEVLGPSARTDAGLWRIPAGAGLAGMLLTVWDERALGLALGAVGAVVAGCCAVCAGHSERRRRRAFDGWRGVVHANTSARGRDYSRAGDSAGGTSST